VGQLFLIEFLLNGAGREVNRNSIKGAHAALVTIRQVKAARALLGWSQADLARRSSISEPTIARLESTDGQLGGRQATTEKITRAIEAAGIEFIEENGGGPGVRLRKAQQYGKRTAKVRARTIKSETD
jgi:transcriptional regulator with XRE-family HTH domain